MNTVKKIYSAIENKSPTTNADTLEIVVFKLDDQEYGLNLENVFEIIRMVAITPLPEADKDIEGVINLRGEIIPVIDLRKCFNLHLKPYTLNTHIIIVQVKHHKMGFIVDCVTKATKFSKEAIKPSQEITADSKHLLGIAKTGDHLLILLDINSLSTKMASQVSKKIFSAQPKRIKPPNVEVVRG